MIHTNNPIIKHKAGLLNLAEELGNVSKSVSAKPINHSPTWCDLSSLCVLNNWSCWAHARRKLMNAKTAQKKGKAGKAD